MGGALGGATWAVGGAAGGVTIAVCYNRTWRGV